MKRLASIALAPLLLGLVAAGLCYLAAGRSPGFYLGSVAMIALIVPPIASMHDRPLDALIAAGCVIDGIALAWIVAAITTSVTAGQWFAAYFVLLAFGAALCAISLLIRGAVGAAIVTVIALLWLSWPIWLSPRISGGVAAWLTPAHPLLAINHVFREMGVWTEQRVMYQLTALGQDVPYRMPASVVSCVALHAAIALLLGWPAWWLRRVESAERLSEASLAS
jgi:hypothetical protein